MSILKQMRENYQSVAVPGLTVAEQQWFRDAKFGMFIHWGLYSLLGKGEWVMFNDRISVSEYAKLADEFVAPDFDADAWAQIAKSAGMKYMVFTTKHHDGFSLFDTKASDFNSVNSAAKRDFVAEYVAACRKAGLKVGFYYSPMDWRFPGYFFPEMYIESALEMKEQCWTQLRELMTNYGKIDMLWFDGEWLAHGGIKWAGPKAWTRAEDWMQSEYFDVEYFWESDKLINMIRQLQPGIMINNRGGWQGDFHTRERRVGDLRTDKPWDSCDCLAASWGWMPDTPMLSLAQLVKNLVNIVTKDGNYLLNVGPTGSGKIESRQADRLQQLGKWLAEYEETIYSTRGGPFLPGPWGGTTFRGNQVYVHITDWVEEKIMLPKLANNELTSYTSLNATDVTVVEMEQHLAIHVPLDARDPFDTIVELTFAQPIYWSGIRGTERDYYGLADGLKK